MQNFSGTQLPFGTSDASLAFALYVAGIPFTDDQRPLSNTYSTAKLKELGYEGPPEKAMEAAFSVGQKGNVEYGFRQTNELEIAKSGFNAMARLVACSDLSAKALYAAVQKNLTTGILAPAEAMAAAACIILKRWREELREWEQVREYTIQKTENYLRHYEGPELATKTFLSGEFYSFAAVMMDYRHAFVNLYKNYPPMLKLHRTGRRHKEGRTDKLPGFIIYSLNADQEIRKELGVQRP